MVSKLFQRPRSALSLATLLSLFLLISGCNARSSGTPGPAGVSGSAGPLIVTTSISPIADLIRQVGGDRVKVTNLVPTGVDPHSYEPKPDDIRQVALSSLFFANGAGEELYLDKLVQNAANSHLREIVLSDGLTILDKSPDNPGNPHLWLDVQNAERYVAKIRDALDQASPANKTYFDQNAADYIKQLQELDHWIAGQIATIPASARQIVVFHDAWPYYAKRYGLIILQPIVHSGEAEPSAQEYVDLIQLIKARHVRAVFGEVGFNPKLVQRLAQDTGVKYVTNLYDDTLGATPQSSSYIAMMRTDTVTIVNALR